LALIEQLVAQGSPIVLEETRIRVRQLPI
jgi:hypothetical protein